MNTAFDCQEISELAEELDSTKNMGVRLLRAVITDMTVPRTKYATFKRVMFEWLNDHGAKIWNLELNAFLLAVPRNWLIENDYNILLNDEHQLNLFFRVITGNQNEFIRADVTLTYQKPFPSTRSVARTISYTADALPDFTNDEEALFNRYITIFQDLNRSFFDVFFVPLAQNRPIRSM